MGEGWNKFKEKSKQVFGTTKKLAIGSYQEAHKASLVLGPRVKEANKITEDVWSLNKPRAVTQREAQGTIRHEIREHTPKGPKKIKSPRPERIQNSPWDAELFNPLNESHNRVVGVPSQYGFYGGMFNKKQTNPVKRAKKRKKPFAYKLVRV